MKLRSSVYITAAVAVAGALIALMVFWVQKKTIDTYDTYMPYVTLGNNVKNITTKSHLSFEKYTSGDQSVDLKEKVFEPLNESLSGLMDAKRAQQTDLDKYAMLNDEHVSRLIDQSIVSVENLKSLSVKKQESAEDESIDRSFSAAYDHLQVNINELVDHVTNKMETEAANLQLVSIVITILIVVIFVLLCWFIFRMQNRNETVSKENKEKLKHEKERIDKMTVFVDSITSGNFENDLELDAEKDALAATLSKMKGQLQANQQEDNRRNWINTGLANFGELLRSDAEMATLGDSIISNLVNYLKANQGGLFVIEGADTSEPYLELKAAYAYQRKKYVDVKIYPGQGLTGQCWIEGQRVFLKEVPDDYMNITSGLGEALPSCILLIPLKINDETYGVLELASFHVFEDFEIEFVEKLAESIASTISNAKINSTTQELLESSQEQSEMLRAQEEEMRQNMEELQATQEEMERVSTEMREQIKIIDMTMATAEFDMSGHVKEVNDNFLNLMGYTKAEVIDKHHRMFVNDEEKNSAEYATFWEKLNRGESLNAEYHRVAKNGADVWIKGIYTPLLDKTGRPVRVVKFAQNITKERQQQRNLAKIANEMTEQLKVINATMSTVEFDLKGNVIGVNNNFLDLLSYTKEEIMGLNHISLLPPEEQDVERHVEFWADLATGQSYNNEFRLKTKGGSDVWIKGMYSPVLNNEGEPLKVLTFAYDISIEKAQQDMMMDQLKELDELKRTLQV
ncbi:PAS domain-containing protein [Fulvivirga ligni]|uniref:PAS domain-containing protein n=1 Tax=Fulvivirga ligni TaxID=2904246 RepID=UPI001F4267C2|nr:PAS domain-containing protein [Fulvivirga ligni]UII18947.1 PAS domain-containing protein [Fulvivirga ligni]